MKNIAFTTLIALPSTIIARVVIIVLQVDSKSSACTSVKANSIDETILQNQDKGSLRGKAKPLPQDVNFNLGSTYNEYHSDRVWMRVGELSSANRHSRIICYSLWVYSAITTHQLFENSEYNSKENIPLRSFEQIMC